MGEQDWVIRLAAARRWPLVTGIEAAIHALLSQPHLRYIARMLMIASAAWANIAGSGSPFINIIERGRGTDEPLEAFRSGGAERIDAAVLPQLATDEPWPMGQPVFLLVVRIGLPPKFMAVLEVRGRKSGRRRSNPVVIATVAGGRYLVSMLGPGSDWVKNVEAAHGDAVIRQGRRRPVHLVAVPPQQRAPILREYVRIASSGRQHFPLPSARRCPTSRRSPSIIRCTGSIPHESDLREAKATEGGFRVGVCWVVG